MRDKWLQPISEERKDEVMEELSQASSPGFDYFLLVMLSCSIATFGLITDSPAVIIGAMLVAPLMSPILGLSLATVGAEERMFERALLALGEGILLALALSALWGGLAQLLPFDLLVELPAEVLARTHPSPFDLGIALAGGAAASYALAQPRISAALPGVAIATALMPPLCTVGLGISTGHWEVAYGAALLFVTNLAAISFAGILVFVSLGFQPRNREMRWHRIPRSLIISAILVLVVTIPLVILTMRLVGQARFNKQVQDSVLTEISTLLPDVQLLDVNLDQSNDVLHLSITILTTVSPSYEQVVKLQEEIALELEKPVALELLIVPGRRLDPLVPPTRTSSPVSSPTLTPTPTTTPTLTVTPLPTQTFTPTAVLAYIANTGGKGVYVYDAPEGTIFALLAESTPIHILYERMLIGQTDWLQVRLPDDRIGWIPAKYVIIRP